MPHNLKVRRHRFATAIVAGVASFIALGALFIATMLLHYRGIDVAFFAFALLRILAISLLVAGLASMATRHLRSLFAAALFGSTAGFLGGVAFVFAFA